MTNKQQSEAPVFNEEESSTIKLEVIDSNNVLKESLSNEAEAGVEASSTGAAATDAEKADSDKQPRITGSMVPVVHEDVVTRIKNIQTIYLGKNLI